MIASVKSCMCRFLSGLPRGAVFTTRDIIGFGKRSAIDSALYRLVKRGELIRLARGVFARKTSDFLAPSVAQIASIKAAAFHKKVVASPETALQRIELIDQRKEEPTTFLTDGCSSSFEYIYKGVRVHLRSASRRKTEPGDDRKALVVRGLWSLGKRTATKKLREKATASATALVRLYGPLTRLMPDWLERLFPWYGKECVNPRMSASRTDHSGLMIIEEQLIHDEEPEEIGRRLLRENGLEGKIIG